MAFIVLFKVFHFICRLQDTAELCFYKENLFLMHKKIQQNFARYKKNPLILTRAVDCVGMGGEMVAILCETAGKTCFSGVLSNFCSERNSFTEQRALSSLLSCSRQRLKHLHMGDVNSIFKLLSDKNEKRRWEQSYRGKCRLMLPFNKIF